MKRYLQSSESVIFQHRRIVILIFLMLSVALGWSALNTRIDAGFDKTLPQNHPYMKVFKEHRDEFGGANRILVAVVSKQDGENIFNAPFLETLKGVTDAVFFLPGVNKATVRSIFTPNVRFSQLTKEGFVRGNVVPPTYSGTDEDVATVYNNVLNAGIIGRLVSNDLTAAIVSADLIEIDPQTRTKLDYIKVAHLLETHVRQPFDNEYASVHIVGFAKAIGDIADGAAGVFVFFGIAFILTALLVYVFTHSVRYTGLLLACSVLAVVWTLGLLALTGAGIDPVSILVPFLVFSIGVSHGVQVVNLAGTEVRGGAIAMDAARTAFQRLILPGSVALASDCVGFLSILLIDVQIIRDLAITASLGMAAILFTNLFLLPVLISYINLGSKFSERAQASAQRRRWIWKKLSSITSAPVATTVLAATLLLAGGAYYVSQGLIVGDSMEGVPELREDSRYNRDSAAISSLFSIGLDVLTVIVESESYACIDFPVVDRIDDFSKHMEQVQGVSAVASLPLVARKINVMFNEGNPKWGELQRISQTLAQSAGSVKTWTGLVNFDCSVMPVLIFTDNHRAETIDHIVSEINAYTTRYETDNMNFKLATGNVGVMAASNDLIRDTRVTMLIWVYAAVLILCLIAFRSFKGAISVTIPLAVVSLLTFAFMSVMEIGLKISTLPMAALGVGIGVDYGIYIFTSVKRALDQGASLIDAFEGAYKVTGNAVMVTGLTLACGVSTWILSDLQFQADMGMLLTFMFLANMLGAMVVLPAIARVLFGART